MLGSIWVRARWIIAAVVVLVGCSPASTRLPVSGSVSFDGTPVDQGAIVLMPIEDGRDKIGGRIADGQYSIPEAKGPQVGKYKVLIYWEKKTGATYTDRDSGDVYDRRAEGLPDIFHSEQTPLEVEIRRGENVHDFHLSPDGE